MLGIGRKIRNGFLLPFSIMTHNLWVTRTSRTESGGGQPWMKVFTVAIIVNDLTVNVRNTKIVPNVSLQLISIQPVMI